MSNGENSDGPVRTGAPLPVPVATVAVRSDASRTDASFLSQLIAERDHLPPQRQRRRAAVSAALLSYHGAAILTPPRLPPGYRKSLVA